MDNQSYSVAAFDDREQAELAVDDLHQAGFSHDDIGLMIRGEEAVLGGTLTDAQATKDPIGSAKGLVTGSVIGGLLAAAAMFLIPGAGPVLATGVLAAALGGAAAGAVTGGLVGAFIGMGISEDEARRLDREFQSGKAVVAVRDNGRELEVIEIIQRHNGRPATPRPGQVPTITMGA